MSSRNQKSREHDQAKGKGEHGHGAHGASGSAGGGGLASDRLRKNGQRVTPIRVAIVEMLEKSSTAMNADDLIAALKNTKIKADRVSVYRTLNMLTETGIAHRIDPGDRVWCYSITSHAHCSDHHHDHDHPHIVCDACGSVECLTDATVSITPRRVAGAGAGGASEGAGKGMRFRVHQQHVTLHGVCEKCEDEADGGRNKGLG